MEHATIVLPPEGMAPPTSAPVPPAETPQPQAAPVVPPAKRVVSMPSDSIAKIRKEERDKGAKRALKEMTDRAKALGFDSLEAMEKAATRPAPKHSRPQARPAAPGTTATAAPAATAAAPASRAPSSTSQWERERIRLENERNAARRQTALAEKKRREALSTNDSLRAEMALREAALRAGVEDTEYALHLLRQHLGTLSPADMQSFDENGFFAGLKKTRPHLFNVQQQPANTSPVAAPPPKQVLPTAVVPETGGGGLDATKLTREQYEEVLRKRGIALPGRM